MYDKTWTSTVCRVLSRLAKHISLYFTVSELEWCRLKVMLCQLMVFGSPWEICEQRKRVTYILHTYPRHGPALGKRDIFFSTPSKWPIMRLWLSEFTYCYLPYFPSSPYLYSSPSFIYTCLPFFSFQWQCLFSSFMFFCYTGLFVVTAYSCFLYGISISCFCHLLFHCKYSASLIFSLCAFFVKCSDFVVPFFNVTLFFRIISWCLIFILEFAV